MVKPTLLSSAIVSTSKLTSDDEFDSFVSTPTGTAGWLSHLPFGGASARTLSGTGEIEYDSDSSVGVNPFSDQNGVLAMTATVAPPGSNPANLPYNSGAISSLHSEAQLYGYFEIRAKLPAGAGFWSAFWLVPTNGLSQSELDVFEVLGKDPSTIYETVHSEVNGVFTQNQAVVTGVNTSTAYHTYGVDWEPTTTTFYIDGVAVNSMATPSNMNTPMMMILNLSIGNSTSWSGAPTSASEFPASYDIDYVRTYATANTVDVTGTTVIQPGTGTATVSGKLLYSANGGAAVAQAGLNIGLVGASGDVVANATTAADGSYTFTGLSPGTYQVLFSPPAGEVVQTGGLASTATNASAAFTLAAGQAYAAGTETFVTQTGQITGQVVYTASTSAAALPGATVRLLSTAGATVASAVTDSAGSFSFNAYPGTYQVAYTVPAGDTVVAGGPASPGTLLTGVLTVVAGQVITLAAETLAPAGGSIAGEILLSAGGAGGAGRAGTPVHLLNAAGASVATAATDGQGNFVFAGLATGTYEVSYVAPAGYVLARGGAAPPNATSPGTGQTAAIAIVAGQTVALPVEQFISSAASIGGSVNFLGGAYWVMQGMGITLLSAAGATLATTTTDAAGSFTFGSLAAGSYVLQYNLPAGASFHGGYENTVTGLSSTLTVAAGQNYTWYGVTVQAVSGALASGTVMLKPTGAAATAAAGVTVSMLNAFGTVLQTTTTNKSGGFQFKGMLQGSYQFSYTLPSGDAFATGGPASVSTGLTSMVTLAAGQSFTLAAETLTPLLASVTGSVTLAGAADAGVAVSLVNASGAVVTTTTTDSTGKYQFANLAPASYAVRFAPASGYFLASGPANSGTGLTAYSALVAGQTWAVAAEDIEPSAATLAGTVTYAGLADPGFTVTLLSSAGATITTAQTSSAGAWRFAGLTPGAYAVRFAPAAGAYFAAGPASATGVTALQTLSAGQTLTLGPEDLESTPATIGGSVTAGGVAAAGVAVSLLNAAGVAVVSTVTASTGAYQFTGLAAGTYAVRIAATAAQMFASGPVNAATGTTPLQAVAAGQSLVLGTEDLEPSRAAINGTVTYAGVADAGVLVTLLNAAGGTVGTAQTGTGGAYQFTGLAPATYAVKFAATAAQVFAAGPASTVTGTTASLALVAGQTLTLVAEDLEQAPASIAGTLTYAGAADPGAAVALLNAAGATVATVLTSSAGVYQFAGLAPGGYAVQFPSTVAQVFATGPANAGTGETALQVLAVGQALTLAPEDLEQAPAAITGSVTYGAAADPGVAVTLLGTGGATLASTVTDASGLYRFAALVPGAYAVQFAATSAQIFASGPASPVTGITPAQALAAGQTLALAAEDLEQAPATIGGSVTYAGSADPGVTVTLLTAAGAVAATTVTGAMGAYQFTGVAAGTYGVQFGSTPAQIFAAGPADVATGVTGPLALAPGQVLTLANEDLEQAPATLAGLVTYAGAADPGEAVNLLNAGGSVIATAVTNAAGAYQFGGLAPGTYGVRFALATGQVFATGPATGAGGTTAPSTLLAGQTLTLGTEDLEQAPASVSGSVSYAGAPDSGVAVSLLNVSGAVLATAVTDANGGYSFSGLPPAAYAVQFAGTPAQIFAAGPASARTGVTSSFTLSAGQNLALANEDLEQAPAILTGSVTYAGVADAGVTILLVGAGGTTVGVTTTSASGTFQFSGLAAGTYQVHYGNTSAQVFSTGPADHATGLTAPQTLSAGQTLTLANEDVEPAPSEITGTVQSSFSGTNPAAASGVTVTLYSATGSQVASMVTGSNGQYDFTGLAAGAYSLGYVPSGNAVLQLGGAANVATGLTSPVTVTAGQTLTLAAQQQLKAPNSITGSMTFEGATYQKLQGFTVALVSLAGTVVGTAVTNSAGVYSFTGLASGTYQLLFTLPANAAFYSGYANATTGLSSAITLATGVNYAWYNVGVRAVSGGVINGKATYAATPGGTAVAQAGTTVSLENAYGTVIGTTTTNSAGAFSFKGMLQGNYQLLYSAPAGERAAAGPANSATGLTGTIALGAGQTLNLATETFTAAGTGQTSTATGGASSVSGVVDHAGQGDSGTGQAGVSVTLLDPTGAPLASTMTGAGGGFSFGSLAPGSYSLSYVAPAGEILAAGSEADPNTGQSGAVTVGAGAAVSIGTEVLNSASNSFVLNGAGTAAVRGAGNFVVTGSASASTLALGAGNQSVTLTGGGDSITVGAGNSTIVALGAGNLVVAGPGMTFIATDGSPGNVIDLNASGQGVITVSGFNTAIDVLDIAGTVAGLGVASDLSNLGSYVTATVSQGNTTLAIDPTGGSGPHTSFAVLDGVSTSVSALAAAHAFSLA